MEWNIYIQGLYWPLNPINLNPFKTPLFLENPGGLIVSPNSIYGQPFRLDCGSGFEKPILTYLDPSVNDPVEVGGSVVYRPNKNVTTGLLGFYRPGPGGQLSASGLYEYSNLLYPIWAQIKPGFDWRQETGEGDFRLDCNTGSKSMPAKSRPGGPPVNQYTAPSWFFNIGVGIDCPVNQHHKNPTCNYKANIGFDF